VGFPHFGIILLLYEKPMTLAADRQEALRVDGHNQKFQKVMYTTGVAGLRF
jgi:hypothetical protein